MLVPLNYDINQQCIETILADVPVVENKCRLLRTYTACNGAWGSIGHCKYYHVTQYRSFLPQTNRFLLRMTKC